MDQWKETGFSVARTLSSYLHLSSLLLVEADKSDIERKTLGPSIDAVLQPGGLISTLSEQLSKSHAVLSKARNRLVSPIHNLPNEILVKIFMYFVRVKYPLELDVQAYYRRLHTLLEVCSLWHEVAISMPLLWDLIPVIKFIYIALSDSTTSRILRRSGIAPLDLAVMTSSNAVSDSLAQELSQYAPRFRTINILSGEPYVIRKIMDPLLECNVVASVSELSLCVTDVENADRLGDELYYFFLPWASQHTLFLEILQSLTRLRLSGATIDWTQASFSTRLVELHVQEVIIGSDDFLYEFLEAISTAPRLQTLELISIISFQFPTSSSVDNVRQVVFPELRSLVLDDLYFNTLSILLRSIILPGLQLTLYLSNKSSAQVSSARDLAHEREMVGINEFCAALEGINIGTLLLKDQADGLSYRELKHALGGVNSLNTVKANKLRVGKSLCGAFAPLTIPKIQRLYLINCDIADVEGLKKLVLRHELEKIQLCGKIAVTSEGAERWKPLESLEGLTDWMVRNVPKVELYFGERMTHAEFELASWRLWGR